MTHVTSTGIYRPNMEYVETEGTIPWQTSADADTSLGSNTNDSTLGGARHVGNNFGTGGGKSPPPNWCMVALVASGTPVPSGSHILSAELTVEANTTNSDEFNTDISLIADDGRWTNVSGSEIQWWDLEDAIARSGQFLDFQLLLQDASHVELERNFVIATNTQQFNLHESDSANFHIQNKAQSLVVGTTGVVASGILTLGIAAGWTTEAMTIRIHDPADGAIDQTPGTVLAESDAVTISGLGTGANVSAVFPFSGDDQITLTAGNRYVLSTNVGWSTAPGAATLGWKARYSTGDADPDGRPSIQGRSQAFNRINYPIQDYLPAPTRVDEVTENAPPHGSTLTIAAPVFTQNEQVTFSGIGPLVQEWVNQPNYDPTKPIGIVFTPGDSVTSESREFHGQDSATQIEANFGSNSNRFQPVLEIVYRPRRVHLV